MAIISTQVLAGVLAASVTLGAVGYSFTGAGTIDDVKAQLGNFKDKIVQYEVAENSLLGKISLIKTDATNKLTFANGEIIGAKNEINDLKANKSLLEAKIQELNSDILTLQADKYSLETQLANKIAEIATLTTALATANESIAALEADLATERESVASLNAQLVTAGETNATLTTNLNEANERITVLEGQLETANSSIATLTAQLGEAQTSISTLTSQLETANTTISEKNTLIGNLNTQITDLNTQLTTLQGEYDTLLAEYNTLSDNYDALVIENDANATEAERANAEVQEANDKVAELQTTSTTVAEETAGKEPMTQAELDAIGTVNQPNVFDAELVVQNLNLTYIQDGQSEEFKAAHPDLDILEGDRVWRVTNDNDFAVYVEYIKGNESGELVANPSHTFYLTETGGTMIIKWQDENGVWKSVPKAGA